MEGSTGAGLIRDVAGDHLVELADHCRAGTVLEERLALEYRLDHAIRGRDRAVALGHPGARASCRDQG